jgi:hypothetical protein
MRVRVTCAGIVIGIAEFVPASGLAHAPLDPSPGYPFAAAAAQALGLELSHTQSWLPINGDFADEAARRWPGDRLTLEDLVGRELGVNNLVVVEFPALVGGASIHVVADFRPDMARVEALLQTIGPGGGRTRPAA